VAGTRQKSHYGSARSGAQVNGQITMKAAQITEKIDLAAKFSPKRSRLFRNRDDLIKPGTILQQLGSFAPDGNRNPGLRKIFPQGPDTGNRENNISDIAELNKQYAAGCSCYRSFACNQEQIHKGIRGSLVNAKRAVAGKALIFP
jgi:hypothetical protein